MHTEAPASASALAMAKPKPASSATPATKARFPRRSIINMGTMLPRSPGPRQGLLRARPEISDTSSATRRPAGEARGGGILDVLRRRATKPAGMDRRRNRINYFWTSPKMSVISASNGARSFCWGLFDEPRCSGVAGIVQAKDGKHGALASQSRNVVEAAFEPAPDRKNARRGPGALLASTCELGGIRGWTNHGAASSRLRRLGRQQVKHRRMRVQHVEVGWGQLAVELSHQTVEHQHGFEREAGVLRYGQCREHVQVHQAFRIATVRRVRR